MTFLDWLQIIAAAWIVVGCTGAVGWSMVVTRLKRHPGPRVAFVDDDETQWAPFLPPVPPPTRAPEPSQRALPDDSPLYLEGYELDAAFYGVLAPSFGDYR